MSGSKKYEKKPFESDCSSSDISANIYLSMLTSPAWKDLSAKQQSLYLVCKAQYYAEKEKPKTVNSAGEEETDRKAFTMNQSKLIDTFGLYSKGNMNRFYQDMAALIEHGFIVCLRSGKNTRTKSVYRYSSMWTQWGKPSFKLEQADMSTTLKRKLNVLQAGQTDGADAESRAG